MVDENLASRFWPNQSAVGKHIKYDGPDWHEIIGVVREVKRYGSEAKPLITIYTPLGRSAVQISRLSVRSTVSDPHSLAAALTREIHVLDKDLPVSEITTLSDTLSQEVSPRRFNAGLLSLFAGIALLLAAVGVYGVTSYTVAQRTHEVGIRMAIGAQKRDVLRLFMSEGLKLVLIGIAIGLAAAFALTRLLASLLFGVSTTDAATFALVGTVLLVVALLACYIPARRATKVDPLVALRYE